MPRFKTLLLEFPRKAMSTRSLDLRAGAEIILADIKGLFKPEGLTRGSARFARLAVKRRLLYNQCGSLKGAGGARSGRSDEAPRLGDLEDTIATEQKIIRAKR